MDDDLHGVRDLGFDSEIEWLGQLCELVLTTVLVQRIEEVVGDIERMMHDGVCELLNFSRC